MVRPHPLSRVPQLVTTPGKLLGKMHDSAQIHTLAVAESWWAHCTPLPQSAVLTTQLALSPTG